MAFKRTAFLNRLKKARTQAKIKQEHVAQVLNLNASSISAIEKGTRRLDVLEFLPMAALYNKPISWFFADYQDEWPQETTLTLENLDPILVESLRRLSHLPLKTQRQLTFQLLSWLDASPQ